MENKEEKPVENEEIREYKDLKVWQKGMELCERVYEITRSFPKEERFGLTAQARGAAVSVPSNIAEGYGRRTTGDYHHFLNIAFGSLCELETQLMLAARLGFLLDKPAHPIFDIIHQEKLMLSRLITRIGELRQ
ncbi:four helix bundle protein [bacterium]|nr:four helix bundle protein [bacterium]